ncbi:hypothetical protein QUF76_03010 [Desulfobacterales bacterium HSG16]|nr:hypothetical protein [Desulfobacterales bacterium HSG16]
MYFIKTVTGIFFTIFCSLIFFQAIYDLSLGKAEPDDEAGVVYSLLVICLGGALFSIRMVLKARAGKKKAVQEKKERRILRLITQKGGRVTPFEIASETSLTIEEAKNTLDNMCENGFGQLQVADTGSTIYVFYGIMSDHEKKSAKNPLEI